MNNMHSILLIDDTKALLEELKKDLSLIFGASAVDIRTWVPTREDGDPLTKFNTLVDAETILVITDYDLTSHGKTGLFGSTIVGWCQSRAIPVGDYSRGNNNSLPKEPDLFELRVPTDMGESARFVASVYRGFKWIREQLEARPDLLAKGSPPAVLAELLAVPERANQFSQYSGRLGASNGALLDKIISTAPATVDPTADEKRSLLGYIIGHLLLNSILRFPGPILSYRSLTAYVASAESEKDAIIGVFDSARYSGPFAELDDYFWLSKTDELLDEFANLLTPETSAETQGELNRKAVEAKLGRSLALHDCPRCQGANGGYFCPFTRRTVCQKADCSVGSNSWVPRGAGLCRVEREFFDEWAPILGI